MRFQVPQFLETEVKVVGPFTIQQFVWIALGGGLLLLTYRLLSGAFFVITAVVTAVVFGGMAFLRIDGLPLFQYIGMAMSFAFGQKKYLFRKETKTEF